MVGYGLESVSKVCVQKFEFFDNFESFIIDLEKLNRLTPKEYLTGVRNFLTALDSSTCKGFITSYDLSKYPIISEVLPSFTDEDEYIKGKHSKESYK